MGVRNFRCMGMAVTLSSEHLELLERESLRSGNGGHQSLFRKLKDQRRGNRQAITLEQVLDLRIRLAKGNTGTWQSAYEALLSYFTDDNKIRS